MPWKIKWSFWSLQYRQSDLLRSSKWDCWQVGAVYEENWSRDGNRRAATVQDGIDDINGWITPADQKTGIEVSVQINRSSLGSVYGVHSTTELASDAWYTYQSSNDSPL